MSTASPKTVKFLKDLFAQATSASETLTPEQQATVATQVAPVEDVLVAVLQDREVEQAVASDAIRVMKTVVSAIKVLTAPPAPPTPVGLVRFNPKRVIPNRFAKGCQVCGTKVPEGAGYAVLTPAESWITICHACAHTTPEERAAQVQAANEAQRKVAEERAAAQVVEQQMRADARVLGQDLFVRANVATQARPAVRVAIPSATGNNDLDFFTVSRSGTGARDVSVLRVIGGHADTPISICQAVAVLERLACVEDVPEAMRTFGRELHFCGRCGTHLTDETSRAVGLGPDCARMY